MVLNIKKNWKQLKYSSVREQRLINCDLLITTEWCTTAKINEEHLHTSIQTDLKNCCMRKSKLHFYTIYLN